MAFIKNNELLYFARDKVTEHRTERHKRPRDELSSLVGETGRLETDNTRQRPLLYVDIKRLGDERREQVYLIAVSAHLILFWKLEKSIKILMSYCGMCYCHIADISIHSCLLTSLEETLPSSASNFIPSLGSELCAAVESTVQGAQLGKTGMETAVCADVGYVATAKCTNKALNAFLAS